MKQLLVDSMLCFSFERPVTGNCLITSGFELHPPDFNRDANEICLFDLILYVPSTIFQLNRDGSSWVEPVLS